MKAVRPDETVERLFFLGRWKGNQLERPKRERSSWMFKQSTGNSLALFCTMVTGYGKD
jgi:hypothetical protein